MTTCSVCQWWKPYSVWNNRDSLPPDTVYKGSCHGGPPTADSSKKGNFPLTEHTAWCKSFESIRSNTSGLKFCVVCNFPESESKKMVTKRAVSICYTCLEDCLSSLT